MTSEQLKQVDRLAWDARNLLVQAKELVPTGSDESLSQAIWVASQAAVAASTLARERIGVARTAEAEKVRAA